MNKYHQIPMDYMLYLSQKKLIVLFFYMTFNFLNGNENDNNQPDSSSIPNLKSLCFIAYCKENNPLNITFKDQEITFDIIDCEHALKMVCVKEDNRLKIAQNELLTIDKKSDNYFHQFILNGSMSTWWLSGSNSGNYLFLNDKILLYVPDSYNLSIFATKDTFFIYSKSHCKSNALIQMCRQHFTTTTFNFNKYNNTMLYEHGNLYIGGKNKVYRLDPENPSTVLNKWKIEEDGFVHFCKQLKNNYLFVKTQFKGSFVINLNTNQIRQVFARDQCRWINFSQTTKKAVIRDSCETLHCYRIHQDIFSDEEILPFLGVTNFAFIFNQDNLLVVAHADEVSEGYSLYDINKNRTIARIRTDTWVKDFYSTYDSLLSYCSRDKVLYNTNYRSLVNFWNYRKKFTQNEDPIIVDKRKNLNSHVDSDIWDDYFY